MKDIVQIGHSVLRANTREITQEDFESGYIQELIADMKQALANEKFGVAIAAPQIGESVRAFVIAGKVFAAREGNEPDSEQYPDQIFINPKIKKVSKKITVGDEGCLSVPGKYGTKVERPDKITITYFDEHGTEYERGAASFLSRIFQHEIDHLNGILYVDHALEVIDVDEELKPIVSP